ncbi:hypothetical protein FM111_08660 [Brevundimonas diminuta 3F5N]|uniref:Uncharacterized protein n=1 Tax=Brevundimonas diminuta 3F5N TaxID=1255603 RepID=A0A1R4G1A8_BREDI|nr:hypothetical protein [Brevundimonas diminuta]SJM62020.1 hypothetical protein FM111_08660 [Brevundimonas diminuta 3F5N]
MKTSSLLAVALTAALATSGYASSAHAQLGGLRKLAPGGGQPQATAGDPDAFLSETLETTKLVWSAATLLAHAVDEDGKQEEARAQLAAIQGASSLRELQAQKASFEANVATVNANAQDAAALQAKYDNASANQRTLMLNAAYNFTIGMMRNVELGQQAPTLISGLQSNPMQATKLGSLRAAAGLLGDQVQATRSMVGPMRTLLSRGGVEVPANATASSAKPIEL